MARGFHLARWFFDRRLWMGGCFIFCMLTRKKLGAFLLYKIFGQEALRSKLLQEKELQ